MRHCCPPPPPPPGAAAAAHHPVVPISRKLLSAAVAAADVGSTQTRCNAGREEKEECAQLLLQQLHQLEEEMIIYLK